MVKHSDKLWLAQCVGLALELAAVLHHTVFFRGNCMLNPFGRDYYWPVLRLWLSHDPSLYCAILAAVVVYVARLRLPNMLIWAAAGPVLIGFLPLLVWIWDVPFAGRPVCVHFHDAKFVVPLLGALRTSHIYALSVLLSLVLVLGRWGAALSFKATAHGHRVSNSETA